VDHESLPAVVTTWREIPGEVVRPGVQRRGFGTKEVMVVMNDIATEMEPNPHVHEDLEQVALILKGRAIYHIGDVGHHVGPGSIMLIPAGVEHWIEPDGDEPIENLDIFAPARSDYAHLLAWMDKVRANPSEGNA
jgi:mannose-6-phosphate isomerase-like protein (cupin superfamily)